MKEWAKIEMELIFIVGHSRSGTTMLGKILGNHSMVHTFHELQFFENVISTQNMTNRKIDNAKLVVAGEKLMFAIEEGIFSKFVHGRYKGEVSALIKNEQVSDLMTLYSSILKNKTIATGKMISCEQTPRYLFVLDEILDAYPDAKIVNIHRDPRAVLLSQKNRWRRLFLSTRQQKSWLWTLTSWSNYHPWVTSKFWVKAIQKSQTYSDHARVISLSYEEMIHKPEESLSKLCGFLGIAFEETMLDIPIEGSSTSSDKATEMGLDKTRVDAWRDGGLSDAETQICEKIAAPEMLSLGYKLNGTRSSFFRIFCTYTSLLPKAAIALVLNRRRFSNILDFLRRRLF